MSTLLDTTFEFNGTQYRAFETLEDGRYSESGKGPRLHLFDGDVDISWFGGYPPIPDDIKKGNRVIVLRFGWHSHTISAFNVARVTKTQITTDDGKRWLRRNGSEYGEGQSFSRSHCKLVGYDERFLAWEKAIEIQSEYHKSEAEKIQDVVKAINNRLGKASLEQLQRALVVLQETP